MAIRINGTAIVNDGKRVRVVTAADGIVHLPAAIERRFVEQGAATFAENAAKNEPKTSQKTKQKTAQAKAVEQTSDKGIDDATQSDYESMTQSQLKAECDARGIAYSPRITKSQLIKVLEVDDAPPELNAYGAK